MIQPCSRSLSNIIPDYVIHVPNGNTAGYGGRRKAQYTHQFTTYKLNNVCYDRPKARGVSAKGRRTKINYENYYTTRCCSCQVAKRRILCLSNETPRHIEILCTITKMQKCINYQKHFLKSLTTNIVTRRNLWYNQIAFAHEGVSVSYLPIPPEARLCNMCEAVSLPSYL